MDNRNELLANKCECAALWERNLWNCRAQQTAKKKPGDKKGERRNWMECNVDDNNNLIDARISSLFN